MVMYMVMILCLLCIGIGIGYLCRRVYILRKLESTISYTIFIMLFIFGITIGADKNIINNIGNFGLQAVLLAVCGVLGSLFASYLAYRILSKKGDQNEK